MYFGSEKDLLFVRYHHKKLFDKKGFVKMNFNNKDNSLFMKYIMSKILGLDQHNIRLDMLQDLVLHWHVYYGWNENPKKWQDTNK